MLGLRCGLALGLVVVGRLADAGVSTGVALFTVLAVLHVEEPELDLESAVLLTADGGLGLDLGVQDATLGDAGMGVEGTVGMGLLDATTLGFLAFLVLIFSSSSEEGYGEMDSRPLCWAAFLLRTELALNDGARFRV